MYVDVILPLAVASPFTYSVSAEYGMDISRGVRVAVQVGQKKIYSGIVYKVFNEKPETEYAVKEIISVLDTQPIVNQYQFKFWEWISQYYMCSLGEVMKAALPSGLKMESETRVRLMPFDDIDIELSQTEELIIQGLEDKEQSIGDLCKRLNRKNILPVIKTLLDRGIIDIRENLVSGYRPKKAVFVRLHPFIKDDKALNDAFETVKRAGKQQAIIEEYIHFATPISYNEPAEILKKDLLTLSNSSTAALKALEQKNILQCFDKVIDRMDNGEELNGEMKCLNPAQQLAFEQIKTEFTSFNTVLLHGVTSSGKTEIYIKLIDEQLKAKKQVLYLLPEIALTTQIISRLKNVFGSKVGVYHSHFNNHERVEVYNNLMKNTGEGYVILGVRSSVFLPYENLGLIIVDEEHENTYKQYDPAPRYNARDSAIVLAHIHGAKILLGTATPSVESYYNAKIKKYGLVELTERFANMLLPEIEIVDMIRARKKKQVNGHFSNVLLDEIHCALDKKEQVILFQNRRGFSPFVICQTCGYTPRCEYCDVSLTYHKYNNQLVCHYCGYAVSMQHHCPQCESADMQTGGLGTEMIEEDLKQFFPNARVERLDLDSTRQKHAYKRIINDFEQQKINILVGTQMVTKGLDFDNVSLVGILNADLLLNFPDFRAYERSFQLMSQVGGRAGRKNKQGRVIIQVSDSKNPIINYVRKHDYLSMYYEQVEERKIFNYPPFSRLVTITLKHTDKNALDNAGNQLSHTLNAVFGNRLSGPENPLINRIQGKYLLNFRLKLEKDKSSQQTKFLLKEMFNQLISARSEFRALQITVDIDPA